MSDDTSPAAAADPKPATAPRHLDERQPEGEAQVKARLAWLKARCGMQVPALAKNAKGHGYDYLSLPQLLSLLDKPMRDAGLVVRWTTWTPSTASMGIRCTVTEVTGGWYEQAEAIGMPEKFIGGRMNGAQARGAFQSYMARYTLMAVLGITADFDSDAHQDGRVRDDTPPQQTQQRQRQRTDGDEERDRRAAAGRYRRGKDPDDTRDPVSSRDPDPDGDDPF